MKYKVASIVFFLLACCSCGLSLDIRSWLNNEIGRDYTNSDINFSVSHTTPDGKVYVPSCQEITATIPVVNEIDVALNAKIEVINKNDLALFESFPEATISGIHNELKFTFNLKPEADASATSLGKKISCRAILTNPENDNKEYGIKFFTILCNTAPPKIPEAICCIDEDAKRYAVYFQIPESELLNEVHEDINRLIIVEKKSGTKTEVDISVSPTKYSFNNSQIKNFEASTNYSELSISIPTTHDDNTYFYTSNQSKSDATRKTYELYLQDKQGLFTPISCSTKVMRLQEAKVFTVREPMLELLSMEGFDLKEESILKFDSGGQPLRVQAPTHAIVDGEVEEITSPVRLSYKLEEEGSADTVAFQDCDDEILVPTGVYRLTVRAESVNGENEYKPSEAKFRVTLQDTVYLDFTATASDFGNSASTPYNSMEAAAKRLNYLYAINGGRAVNLIITGLPPGTTTIDPKPLENIGHLNIDNQASDSFPISGPLIVKSGTTMELKGHFKDHIQVESNATCKLLEGFVLDGVVVDNGHASSGGYGAICNLGTLKIQSGATIKNCGSGKGGAIWNAGELTMEAGSTIMNCYAKDFVLGQGEGYGGAIYNTDSGKFWFKGGEIKDCGKDSSGTIVTRVGGAIYNERIGSGADARTGYVYFSGGKIYGCAVELPDGSSSDIYGCGGAIYNDGHFYIYGSAEIGDQANPNSANHKGCGIYNNFVLGLGNDGSGDVVSEWTGSISHHQGDGLSCSKNSMTYFYSGNIANNVFMGGPTPNYPGVVLAYGALFAMHASAYIDESNNIQLMNNVVEENITVANADQIKYADIVLGESYVGTSGKVTKILVATPDYDADDRPFPNTPLPIAGTVVITSGVTDENIQKFALANRDTHVLVRNESSAVAQKP